MLTLANLTVPFVCCRLEASDDIMTGWVRRGSDGACLGGSVVEVLTYGRLELRHSTGRVRHEPLQMKG